jgi:hypothetical protein
MAEPSLDRPGVVALVGQGVAAGVTKHVGMRLELQARTGGGTLDHPGKAGGRERGTALADEDVPSFRLAAREADLLPVPYFHVVFTLPAAIADIAYQNKAAIYDILFTASAETMTTIAADPRHLGARIGITSVLHTWGSALTHHRQARRASRYDARLVRKVAVLSPPTRSL